MLTTDDEVNFILSECDRLKKGIHALHFDLDAMHNALVFRDKTLREVIKGRDALQAGMANIILHMKAAISCGCTHDGRSCPNAIRAGEAIDAWEKEALR